MACIKNYSFKMNIMEDIFEIRSWTVVSANDDKIYTVYQYVLHG